MSIHLQRIFSENFGVRVFAVFTLLISIISFSFTAFLIRYESKSLTESVINRGILLVRVLAQSSRIGVFSENKNLLEGSLASILQQKGVLAVSIFNLEGELLRREENTGTWHHEAPVNREAAKESEAFGKLKKTMSPFHLEEKNTFHFWSCVISGSGYTQEESLYLGEEPLKRGQNIIGFVQLTLDKEMLNQRLDALLHRSILLGILFLFIGSGLTYLVARGITKPLNKLTEGVKALAHGADVEMIPVDTEDEIGKLAKAFNNMSQSLKMREEALRESERRLRSLSSQLMKAQEQERSRLSKELHDELGQALALLKHRVRSLQRNLPESRSWLYRDCEQTRHYIDEIIENVRRLSRDLSPSILQDLGLSSALRWLIGNFAKQYSLETSFDIDNIDHLFSQDAQTNLYRTSQEALTNIGKHAEANHVSFTVKKNETSVSFVIEDDGKGFDVNGISTGPSHEKGLGLNAMEERAHILGAFLEVRSRTGEGTRIALTIPIEKGGMV